MSFDLGIWFSSKPTTDEEAGRKYVAFCEENDIEALIEPNAAVARFVEELTTEYPQIDDVPVDALDDCPWNNAFDLSEGHCIITIAWSRAEEIAPHIVELAAKHGLICYDPQNEKVYLPPQLR